MIDSLHEHISNTEWEHYLSRPFSLFQTSVWNSWYNSQEIENIFGMRLHGGFFVEYPKNMVRHYRVATDLNNFFATMHNIAKIDIERGEQLLNLAVQQNEKVKKIIFDKIQLTLDDALVLCREVALVATVFPYFAGEIFLQIYGEDFPLTKKAFSLRRISYYPAIFSELLIPAAAKELYKYSGVSADFLPYVLLDEIKEKNIGEIIRERKRLADNHHHFIFLDKNDTKIVSYVDNPLHHLQSVDNSFLFENNSIQGQTGNSGKVVGKVKKILTNSLDDVLFEEKSILVAVSTNPMLVPIMKKSAAIVTDEGGTLCHAAIIARELGLPCVIGTKVATRLLCDGDMVEVDATAGIVRKLEN